MAQKHARTKDPFKMQKKPKDFVVTEYRKFTDIVSDSV